MATLNKNLKELQKHLENNEEVINAVFGQYETKRFNQDTLRNGILVTTNKRVLFFAKKMGGYDMEVFPYSSISSIEFSKQLMGYNISFFASGNKVKMKRVVAGDIDELIQTIKSKISKNEDLKEQDDIKQVNSTGIDVYEQLEKLKTLYDKDIINNEEYEEKRKILLEKIC